MDLFIRNIGIACTEANVTLANLTFYMHRMVFRET